MKFDKIEDFPDLDEINRLNDEDLLEYLERVEAVFKARDL